MPYPPETILLAIELVQSGGVLEHLWATFWRTLWGFLGAWVLGILTGVAMGSTQYGEKFFLPYLTAGLAIPAVSWAAMTTLIFGFGHLAPIVATTLVTFPYITINVWKGVEDIDMNRVRMSQAFNVSNSRLLLRYILPAIAPALFSGFRFALAIAWKIVTIAEMFASSSGVGAQIVNSFSSFRYEQAWAWVVLFMIIILFIEYVLVRPLESRVFGYRETEDITDLI
jgi:NitT/TauT family transport system permease protein